MEATVTEYKRCDVVKVTGRIDSETAPKLEEVLKSITDSGHFKIVLDLNEVNFISSKGWWVMIDTQKTCRRYNRGELILSCLDDKIRKSLDLVGMGDYFKSFDDILTAVGSF